MLAALTYQFHIGTTGWTIVYNTLAVETFWLVIIGGFIFIMWADKKKLCH